MEIPNRVKFLRIAICTALIIGIFFSIELWFPTTRSFPRIPLLVAPPETLVPLAERSLSVALIILLALAALVRQTKAFSIAAITCVIVLILFDQMRLQPWIYQYLLLLIVLTLRDKRTEDETASYHTLHLLRVVIASLYFWSGLQKLNFSFSYEILPELLMPLLRVLPAIDLPLGLVGIFVASCEALIGVGLLFHRTRKLSALLAVAMHLTILGLLIAKSYNSIVWAWNAALIVITTITFWSNDIYNWRKIINWRRASWERKAAILIALMAAILPILSFFGRWDMYLSGALYSGNTPVAVLSISEDVFQKLPEKARQQVFTTTSTGEQMLPLSEWSTAELNVPVYPEPRIFQRLTRDICRFADDKNKVALVMKDRPTILDGRYIVTRTTCLQLDR